MSAGSKKGERKKKAEKTKGRDRPGTEPVEIGEGGRRLKEGGKGYGGGKIRAGERGRSRAGIRRKEARGYGEQTGWG